MKKSLIFAFSLIGTVGISTALPLVVFAFLGRYLDKRWGTAPKLLIIGIGISAIISIFTLRRIVRKAKENMKDI